MPMKVAVLGSRDFKTKDEIRRRLAAYAQRRGLAEIVSGGAAGADRLGEALAVELGLPVRVFSADWKAFGRAAGPKRNQEIAAYADVCFAFINKPLNHSRGTASVVAAFKKAGKAAFVYEIDESSPAEVV
jgi:hypothetical protein